MNQTMLALSLGLGGMVAAANLAFGAPQCDTRERVLQLLADRHNKTRRAVGLAGDSAVMEPFAADATGTWSITLTRPDGRICLMVSGSTYEPVTEDLPAKGNPA